MSSLAQQEDPATRGAAWLRAMFAGRFDEAWRQTDALEASRRAGSPVQPHHLRWDGTPFQGRSVLVRCLHGLGDTLQFMRFVPQVAAQARELHFLVQPMLLELLQGVPGLGLVSNAWTDHPPAHEVEIEVMELAYALRCDAARLPPPHPALRDSLAPLLGLRAPGDDRLNVALLWAASDWDASRSVTLETLRPLLSLCGARFFNLQQGPAATDPAAERFRLAPLWEHTSRVEDAASAMLAMDLVICVDGMPAHLAGTLGIPTWVMLKHDADWRWMHERPDTPWYPGMRLFRQSRPGDWQGVAHQLAAALTDEAPKK